MILPGRPCLKPMQRDPRDPSMSPTTDGATVAPGGMAFWDEGHVGTRGMKDDPPSFLPPDVNFKGVHQEASTNRSCVLRVSHCHAASSERLVKPISHCTARNAYRSRSTRQWGTQSKGRTKTLLLLLDTVVNQRGPRIKC